MWFAWHRPLALHVHRRHALLHGRHMFRYECISLFKPLCVHHLFVHLVHGIHLVVHSEHLFDTGRFGFRSRFFSRWLLGFWGVRVMLHVLRVGLSP
jgi:hypothetical protein